jgi:hypothetical protein
MLMGGLHPSLFLLNNIEQTSCAGKANWHLIELNMAAVYPVDFSWISN